MRDYEARLLAGLDAMSPLKVLGRGYAIASTADLRALRDAGEVNVGDRVELRLARGRVATKVTEILSGSSDGAEETPRS